MTITTEATPFIRLVCPPWCTNGDEKAYADVADDAHEGPRVAFHDAAEGYGSVVLQDHTGPAFGPHIRGKGITFAGTEVIESQWVSVDLPEKEFTTDDIASLRGLIADLQRAADWLDPDRVAVIDLSEFEGFSEGASMTVRGPDAAESAERLRSEVFLKPSATVDGER